MDVRCGECKQIVEGRAVFADNKVYHPGHFRCSYCQLAIRHYYYLSPDLAKPMCHHCKSSTNPVCKRCKSFVGETFIRAEGEPFHLDCFVCFACKKPFPGGEYFLFNENALDLDCYWSEILKSTSG